MHVDVNMILPNKYVNKRQLLMYKVKWSQIQGGKQYIHKWLKQVGLEDSIILFNIVMEPRYGVVPV